jgi:EF hand
MQSQLRIALCQLRSLGLITLAVFWISAASAQPPGSGFGGPPGGGFGGPPGGGDRGSRGGPPGSSFPSGGDRGSRGGPPGAGGGDRGSFDSSQFLGRLDVNGNGAIDPEEMQGPARFMLDRLGRENSDIASALAKNQPISISKITKTMEKMRSSSSSSSSNSSSSSSSSSPASSTAPKEPEPLVPGFGVKVEAKPILGFGPEGADLTSTIKVEERDLKEAKERMDRYDTNKDGVLDQKEVDAGKWSDNPWAFDRNKDKKLTQQEMAVRYAKRRMDEEAQKSQAKSSTDPRRSNSDPRRSNDGRRSSDEKKEVENLWANQTSYKITPQYAKGSKLQGLPEWFSSGDANGDGQVMMNEYATSWDDSIIAEFNKFDTNGDGSITALEALAAVKKGILRGASGSSSTATSGSNVSTTSNSSSVSSVSKPSSSAPVVDRTDLPADADEKWVKFVQGNIAKVDKDKNSRVTIDEWLPSDGDFKAVDTNGDGSVSVGEYYNFRKNRKK